MVTKEQVQALEQLYPNVPLHKELEWFLEEDASGFDMLRHPLVYGVPYIKDLNNFYNKQYEQKVRLLEKAKDENDWESYIWMHERPYRPDALLQVVDTEGVSKSVWHPLVEQVWTDTENVRQYEKTWMTLFTRLVAERGYLSPKDVVALPTEGQKLRLYRGITMEPEALKAKIVGFSWTTDLEKAKWFSGRLAGVEDTKIVLTAELPIDKVVLKCDDRGESEIVALPQDVMQDPQVY